MKVTRIYKPRRQGKTLQLLALAKDQANVQFISTCARSSKPFVSAGHVPYNGQGGPLLLIDEADHVILPATYEGYNEVVYSTSDPNFVLST